MNPWNLVRQAWYAWARQLFAVLALLAGLGLAVVGVVMLSLRNWPEAGGALASAAPLISVSLANLFLEFNQPQSRLYTSDEAIGRFMRDFISQGSRVHIGSYNLSWVRGQPEMQEFLKTEVQRGKDITVFVNKEDSVTDSLKAAGVRITTYNSEHAASPRFTLLNLGRTGAERLAVAREGLPTHWIDIYTVKRHPQIIALAQAYVYRMEGGG